MRVYVGIARRGDPPWPSRATGRQARRPAPTTIVACGDDEEHTVQSSAELRRCGHTSTGAIHNFQVNVSIATHQLLGYVFRHALKEYQDGTARLRGWTRDPGQQIRDGSPSGIRSKFGLLMGVEFDGGIYGGFRNDAVSFHFGIVPIKGRAKVGDGGVAITFHVDDFKGYMAELTQRGLEPVGEAHDEEGHFAVYRDPEGNELTVWGD